LSTKQIRMICNGLWNGKSTGHQNWSANETFCQAGIDVEPWGEWNTTDDELNLDLKKFRQWPKPCSNNLEMKHQNWVIASLANTTGLGDEKQPGEKVPVWETWKWPGPRTSATGNEEM
jgi:hypothetical protein